MSSREDIIARIRSALPFGADTNVKLADELVLADLGVTSVHLITMLLTLQREYGLDLAQMTYAGMPSTVGELVTLVERGASTT